MSFATNDAASIAEEATPGSTFSDDDMWGGEDAVPTGPEQRIALVDKAREESASIPEPEHRVRAAEERHSGQLRFADRMITEYGHQLRRVHGIGWHEWDGFRWKADDQVRHLAYAVKTVRNALSDLQHLDGDTQKALFKDIRRSESAGALEGIAKIAGALEPVSTSSKSLDADPHLFNTAGGVLDLKNGTLRESRHEDLITKVAGACADIDGGRSELWENFLHRILPQQDVRDFVQRLIGCSMYGAVLEQILPLLTGTGANGKSVLAGAIQYAFGDYAITVDPEMLMESKHQRHASFLMRLRGARLAFCSETEKGRKFSEATMKRLTGGEPIEANLMRQDPIEFDPTHTLIMLTNHLPEVSGDDPAIWRRILVVPFDVVIPEEERDTRLPEKLRDAAPQILAWAYQGWLAYQEQGLNPPDAVRAKTAAYRAESDIMARFLEEETVSVARGSVGARYLYEKWSEWCFSTGQEHGTAGSEVAFAKALELRGYKKKRSSAGNVYKGLGLLAGLAGESGGEPEPTEPEYEEPTLSDPPTGDPRQCSAPSSPPPGRPSAGRAPESQLRPGGPDRLRETAPLHRPAASIGHQAQTMGVTS
ncbi:hypothetical protein C9F11_08835 [Streptomyces sp. YIM 121038]|uniref:DNA primase family protein n=1 Tax=Streptomyces sp. YIM 121038 TaxID=2136401 RepID=UPI001110717F|nr:phage/plasmid primase, P4 family [Streptomyces sp. YIM 121038]QCX75456.1 hypothetical protein C9F11_08835 [Streptomyces sp. YIM 121038]